MIEAAIEVVCCFCGKSFHQEQAVILAVYPTDDRKESQNLYCHPCCLKKVVSKCVPLHPDLYSEIEEEVDNNDAFPLSNFLSFLNRLSEAHISYHLIHSMEDAIEVHVDVPGERWEVDYFADGQVYVERFTNPSGEIKDEKELEELFRLFSD